MVIKNFAVIFSLVSVRSVDQDDISGAVFQTIWVRDSLNRDKLPLTVTAINAKI